MKQDVFCDDSVHKPIYYETKHFMALLDIRPLLPGHSLVVPKRHVLDITELSEEELADLSLMLKTLLPKLLKAYGADAYNLSINAGERAGMLIQHLHLHIVPRGKDDPLQGKIISFYSALQAKRAGYARDVEKETKRLRKIFNYKPGPDA